METLKKIIEWSEKESSRSRKLIMISTVSLFIFVSFIIFLVPIIFNNIVKIPDSFTSMYGYLCGVMGTVYGFFTATKSKPYYKDQVDNKVNDYINKIKEGVNND